MVNRLRGLLGLFSLGFLAFLIAGCGGSGSSSPSTDSALEQRVEGLLARMSLEEKIDQMAGDTLLVEVLDTLAEHEPWSTPDNERLGIPGLRFVDGPRGVRTCFPVAMARGAAWDPALEERIGEVAGREARAIGANVINAPCINLLRHPGWGRAQETYGEDPYLLGRMGVAFVEGAQGFVMADVKHYALNSIEENRFLVDARVDERTLREVYLPHFRRCVQEAGAAAVMCAYNRVNGTYCCQNRHLLREILKEEWGFEGFVVSDWNFAVHDTVASLRAGLDVEMPSAFFYGFPLTAAVVTGRVPEDLVDEAVRRILRQKIRFGLLDGPGPVPTVDPDEGRALALEAAREGIVLLKNEGEILPLDRSRIGSIAVIGRFADRPMTGDEGSSKVAAPEAVSPFDGITERAGPTVRVRLNIGKDLASARRAAREADVTVVVAALTPWDEGEYLFFVGGDRETLRLHPEDERLIREVAGVTDRCVVIVEAGSAVSMDPWLDDVEAVLMAWYPGEQGGKAIGDILFGDVVPGGRLPVTFPGSADPLYPFGTGLPAVTYGYFHGYRYYDRAGLEPLFPFGFGLGYTEFAYGDFSVDPGEISADGRVTVSLEVTNTGRRAGVEVVQVYVGREEPGADEPIKVLGGFRRVCLAPCESRRMSVVLEASDLARFDPATSAWGVEEGGYRVYVGASSRDIRLTGAFRVRGPGP